MADLPQQETRVQYTADGAETTFNYDFLIPDDESIAVYVTLSSELPVPEDDIQTLSTDYTVTNSGVIEGGTVVFLSGHIPPSASIVTLVRAVPYAINTQFQESPTYITGENLDEAFENQELQLQQLNDIQKDTCLKYVINAVTGENPVFAPQSTIVEYPTELGFMYWNGTNWVVNPLTPPSVAGSVLQGSKSGFDCEGSSDILTVYGGQCASKSLVTASGLAHAISLGNVGMTKNAILPFQTGTGNGAALFDTTGFVGWGYIFAIGNSTDATVVDICIGDEWALASIPSGFNIYRRIGCVYYNVGGMQDFSLFNGVFNIDSDTALLVDTVTPAALTGTGQFYNYTKIFSNASISEPGLPELPIGLTIPLQVTVRGTFNTLSNLNSLLVNSRINGETVLGSGINYGSYYAYASAVDGNFFNQDTIDMPSNSRTGADRGFNLFIEMFNGTATNVSFIASVFVYSFTDLFNDW